MALDTLLNGDLSRLIHGCYEYTEGDFERFETAIGLHRYKQTNIHEYNEKWTHASANILHYLIHTE